MASREYEIAEKYSLQEFPNGTSIAWVPEARQRCFAAILKAMNEIRDDVAARQFDARQAAGAGVEAIDERVD